MSQSWSINHTLKNPKIHFFFRKCHGLLLNKEIILCWSPSHIGIPGLVGIPMGTNCAPLVADLFLFCYERDFMMSHLMISRMMLVMRLTLLQDIWTIF